MAIRYYANAPATTLSASCSAVATTISVNSTAGLPIQFPYTLIIDRGLATEECVSVVGASGNNLNVQRGIDGTTAFAHASNSLVEHGISAQDVREPNTHINSDNGVHGVVGKVVGDTDAQALTNKDLSSPSNTFPSTLALDADLQAHVDATELNVPVGGGLIWFLDTEPAGGDYLFPNGQAISRSAYPELFAKWGTTFGAGNGSTTFNLPNLGTNFLRYGVVGTTGGATAVTLTSANLPPHTHTIDHDHPAATTSTAGSHDHAATFSNQDGENSLYYRMGASGGSNTGTNNALLDNDGSHNHTFNVPAYSGNSGNGPGSSSPVSILNPFFGIKILIRCR